jgi:hypothetical protein
MEGGVGSELGLGKRTWWVWCVGKRNGSAPCWEAEVEEEEEEEEEERERKKKREKREMAKITYRVVLGSLEMVVVQGNVKGGCPGGGGDGGFCIVCLSPLSFFGKLGGFGCGQRWIWYLVLLVLVMVFFLMVLYYVGV